MYRRKNKDRLGEAKSKERRGSRREGAKSTDIGGISSLLVLILSIQPPRERERRKSKLQSKVEGKRRRDQRRKDRFLSCQDKMESKQLR